MSKKNIFFASKKLGEISAKMESEIQKISEQENKIYSLLDEIPTTEENRKLIESLVEIRCGITTAVQELGINQMSLDTAYDKIVLTLIEW